MKLSERIYQCFLKAYARKYRDHYMEPMALHFRDQLSAASGPIALSRLWLGTLGDLLRTVPQSYLSGSATGRVFVRMDQQARQAIFFAHHEAVFSSSTEITVEHLVLGVLRSDKQFNARIGGPTAAEELTRRMRGVLSTEKRTVHFGNKVSSAKHIPLGKECRMAIDDAAGTGQGRVGTNDVIAAVLRQPETGAARLLREFGIKN